MKEPMMGKKVIQDKISNKIIKTTKQYLNCIKTKFFTLTSSKNNQTNSFLEEKGNFKTKIKEAKPFAGLTYRPERYSESSVLQSRFLLNVRTENEMTSRKNDVHNSC